MKHPITQTQNGVAVYVDLVKSQAAAHIAQRPYLLGLVKEVLRQSAAEGDEVHLETDMGRVIGYNFVVETTDKDTILYGQLVHDPVYTRFVKNSKPSTTQFLTVVLRRDEHGNYELHDTWIGLVNPPRPGSGHETAASKPYWANHAFVLEEHQSSLQLRTITKVCPY